MAPNGDLPPMNALMLGIDHPDGGLAFGHRQRRRRNLHQRLGLGYQAPDDRRSKEHSRWRINEFDFDLIVACDRIGLRRYLADFPGHLDLWLVRKPDLTLLT